MEKLTAEQIQLILARKGQVISLAQAEQVLAFIRRMATIIITHHLAQK